MHEAKNISYMVRLRPTHATRPAAASATTTIAATAPPVPMEPSTGATGIGVAVTVGVGVKIITVGSGVELAELSVSVGVGGNGVDVPTRAMNNFWPMEISFEGRLFELLMLFIVVLYAIAICHNDCPG